MSTSVYDTTMDVDMDIDLGGDMEIPNLEEEEEEEEAMSIVCGLRDRWLAGLRSDIEHWEPGLHPSSSKYQNGNHQRASPSADAVPEKVHIRGLDILTTSDIRTFASEHYSSSAPVRIEWIDDTSANIVYSSSSDGDAALASLTDSFAIQSDQLDPLELRKAKTLSSHPTIELLVRQATVTDVKKPHAREASRFYLMNPDKDPRERRRGYDDRRSRPRSNDKRIPPRKSEEPEIPFDVNMYDDDETSMAARRSSRRERLRSRSSDSSGGSRRRVRVRSRDRRGGDLMCDRLARDGNGRLRDRSASPTRSRDGDGTLGFDESGARLQDREHRIPTTPPRERRGAISHPSNAGKELLGIPNNGRSVLQPASPLNAAKELFPNKSSPIKETRELFARRGSPALHRRTGAFDAADGTADLFADRMINSSDSRQPRSLADRISVDPLPVTENVVESAGFSIRGASQQIEPSGFSIKGAAYTSGPETGVKELFPTKLGTDLFDGRIKGRGLRRRAEDMYF